MADSDERFAVRLAAPPGLGPEGVREIAGVLSHIAGRPTEELARALVAGPVVVSPYVDEAEARGLVQTFRSLGAQADLVEAVDADTPPSPQDSANTRPLFAVTEAAQVDGAWRHVVTGSRSAVRLDNPHPSLPPADQSTRRLSTVSPEALGQTQPLRSGASLVTGPQSAASAPGAARLTMTPGPRAGAIFRPRPEPPQRDPATASFEVDSSAGARPTGPADTQEVDSAAVNSAAAQLSSNRPRAQSGPVSQPPTVRFDSVTEAMPTAGADTAPRSLVALPDATQPILRAGLMDTCEMNDPAEQAPTRPFNRTADTLQMDESATHRLAPGVHATTRQAAVDDPDTLPRFQFDEQLTDHNMPRIDPESVTAGMPRANDALETGSQGSVQAGPKIFQLAAPQPGPTETGNLAKLARVDPLTDASMRIALEATPLVAAAAQAQELARQQALADGPGADVPRDSRPGIYKLSNRRGAHEPAVVPPSPSRPQPVSEPVGAPPSEAPFPAGDSDVPRPFPADASRAAQRPQAERGQLAQRPMAPPLIPAAMREVHSPGTAAWYSVLLPGLGQVYNGQRERGILFALGTPLIVPYLYGIYDAFTTAEDIARGKYAAPDPHTRNAAYVGQIALALAVIFGMFVGALLWHRSRMPQRPPPVAEMPYAPASAPGVTGALPVDVAAPASRQPLGDGLDVDALMKKGRMACAQGLYNECEEIMHEVIARDPGNRDAYNLLVEASSQRKPAPSSAGRSAAP